MTASTFCCIPRFAVTVSTGLTCFVGGSVVGSVGAVSTLSAVVSELSVLSVLFPFSSVGTMSVFPYFSGINFPLNVATAARNRAENITANFLFIIYILF
jgi:hypothetical protein